MATAPVRQSLSSSLNCSLLLLLCPFSSGLAIASLCYYSFLGASPSFVLVTPAHTSALGLFSLPSCWALNWQREEWRRSGKVIQSFLYLQMFNIHTCIEQNKAIAQTQNMSFLLPPTDGISSHVSHSGLCIVLFLSLLSVVISSTYPGFLCFNYSCAQEKHSIYRAQHHPQFQASAGSWSVFSVDKGKPLYCDL